VRHPSLDEGLRGRHRGHALRHLEGLPPGEYELSWWHEELGKGKTEKVKVEAGQAATLTHKVSAEKKAGGGRRR
jgi:hypothetical protein